jgi:hypothetical protein
VAGLGDIGSVRRVLEIAVLDVLGLDNSLARSKVLIGAAGAAAKLLEAEREQGWRWSDREEGSRLSRTIGHAARAGTDRRGIDARRQFVPRFHHGPWG